MTAFVPDGYCGLYCGSCPQYLATKAGTAVELGLEACQGCKSDVVAAGWCAICTHKKCARDKGIEFCYECAEYPCQDLEGFKNAPDWPYHTEVYGYMVTIKEQGKDAWLSQMAERWSCPLCGTEASWWDLACKTCGGPLKGYQEPAKDS